MEIVVAGNPPFKYVLITSNLISLTNTAYRYHDQCYIYKFKQATLTGESFFRNATKRHKIDEMALSLILSDNQLIIDDRAIIIRDSYSPYVLDLQTLYIWGLDRETKSFFYTSIHGRVPHQNVRYYFNFQHHLEELSEIPLNRIIRFQGEICLTKIKELDYTKKLAGLKSKALVVRGVNGNPHQLYVENGSFYRNFRGETYLVSNGHVYFLHPEHDNFKVWLDGVFRISTVNALNGTPPEHIKQLLQEAVK